LVDLARADMAPFATRSSSGHARAEMQIQFPLFKPGDGFMPILLAFAASPLSSPAQG